MNNNQTIEKSWEKEFDELLANPNMIHFNAYQGEVALLKYFIYTLLLKEREGGKKEGRLQIIEDVEDTIAEFGDQGMECVAGILQEGFHGGREVIY